MKKTNTSESVEKKKVTMFYGADVITFENARILRENMTFAEKLLWQELSENKLDVRFKPQHPISRFIADFYCHKAKLVIEIDGESHFSIEALQKDTERTDELEQLGLTVIRFTNEQVTSNMLSVIEEIRTALRLSSKSL